MGSSHKFIEHTADIAFDVQADTLKELFIESAYAWRLSVIGKVSGKALETKNLLLSAESLEELLVSFLNEINYNLMTKRWLTMIIDRIEINEVSYKLNVNLQGMKIEDNAEIKEEIKSVTYHQMEIIKVNNKFSTRVVFDI